MPSPQKKTDKTMKDLEDISWFLLRIRFNRIASAQKDLAWLKIETYLPTEMRDVSIKGKRVCTKLMPILSNYIFVKTSFQLLNEACMSFKYLSYASSIENGQRKAIRIPENQMTLFQEFIEGNYKTSDCKKEKFMSGEKYIIKSGIFKGSEVILLKQDGKVKKTYFLEIDRLNVTMKEDSLNSNVLSRI